MPDYFIDYDGRGINKGNVYLFDCYRTESVVEKLLTNWLSLCMYPYLKTHVNKSLFMLYKAIKHQTEKGPVDAVTAEARYSLSEDRLLREKTESRTLVSRLLSRNNCMVKG